MIHTAMATRTATTANEKTNSKQIHTSTASQANTTPWSWPLDMQQNEDNY
ncbi:MAG: hypothetical protein GY775_06760 [Candidatus Scalindua sp.]|nr:hypothetical protein [Candidatus Scalindua sp.]